MHALTSSRGPTVRDLFAPGRCKKNPSLIRTAYQPAAPHLVSPAAKTARHPPPRAVASPSREAAARTASPTLLAPHNPARSPRPRARPPPPIVPTPPPPPPPGQPPRRFGRPASHARRPPPAAPPVLAPAPGIIVARRARHCVSKATARRAPPVVTPAASLLTLAAAAATTRLRLPPAASGPRHHIFLDALLHVNAGAEPVAPSVATLGAACRTVADLLCSIGLRTKRWKMLKTEVSLRCHRLGAHTKLLCGR
ncbi:WAS/WASL-interacting protein family member 3-like [Panicum hallii]|nr:WAS/WASL-interacting protein family member 3-like [Panicum hallii]